MRKTKHDWASHVAAIKAQGISPIAYAKQHGLVQSTLYRLQCFTWGKRLVSPFVMARVRQVVEAMQ
jgi:lambda repressor-like predicted transcriptional regulator